METRESKLELKSECWSECVEVRVLKLEFWNQSVEVKVLRWLECWSECSSQSVAVKVLTLECWSECWSQSVELELECWSQKRVEIRELEFEEWIRFRECPGFNHHSLNKTIDQQSARMTWSAKTHHSSTMVMMVIHTPFHAAHTTSCSSARWIAHYTHSRTVSIFTAWESQVLVSWWNLCR